MCKQDLETQLAQLSEEKTAEIDSLTAQQQELQQHIDSLIRTSAQDRQFLEVCSYIYAIL